VQVFWAKNIHITDLELDNISNIKMQRNNKLKPSRKKISFSKNGFARIYMLYVINLSRLGCICYLLFIYQGWSVPCMFEDKVDVTRFKVVSLISYTWLYFHLLSMAILRTTPINKRTIELKFPPAF